MEVLGEGIQPLLHSKCGELGVIHPTCAPAIATQCKACEAKPAFGNLIGGRWASQSAPPFIWGNIGCGGRGGIHQE